MIILKAVILVVEDDAIEAMDISRTLSSFGYEVQGPVFSGKEALEKVAAAEPDLIIMDITLKGDIDGIDTAHILRKNLNIPLIFLTAHSDEATVEKAKITEPQGYLIKPFDGIELRHAIEIALYRNKMEKKLKENEKKFQLLFDRTPVPYQSLDKKGYFLDVNQAWMDTLGYSREEVIGKNFAEFLAPDFAPHFEKNFPMFKDAGEIHGVRFKMLHKDGSVFFVEYDGKIGYDEMGNFKQTHCIFHDITEKYEMEKALTESEEKYRTLFNANPDYTFLMGPDGKIKDVNEATTKVIGLSKEKILGSTFSDLAFKLDWDVEPYMDKIGMALQGKHIDPFETKITDLNDDIHWLNIFTSIIKKDGSISYILIIARDITLEKRISKEIKGSLREKEVLLQEIHHRVKNNMQIISSLLSLQTKYVDYEGSQDVLKEIQNRVKSMALVHEKLYRSEDLTHINIYNYINNLVSDLFFSYGVSRDHIIPIINIEEIKLNIETAVPCGLIINELVSNVLKHAFSDDKCGKIWLSLHLLDDDQIELIIADNGLGLPNDFNLDSSNSLGMQLVNSLVNQLDGSIKIKRTNGTEFNIKFKELMYENRI